MGRVGVWEWSEGEGTLWWSREMYAIFGLEEGTEGLSSDRFIELVHPDDLSLFVSVMHAKYDDESIANGRRLMFRILPRDGEVIHVVTELRVYPREGRDPLVRGVVQDVTELRQAETLLRQYQKIISVSHDMMALVDPEYVYLAANPMYCNAFFGGKDVVGKSVDDIFGGSDFLLTVKRNLALGFIGQEVGYKRWIPVHGHRVWMDVSLHPYREPDGTVSAVAVIARDVTSQSIAQRERREMGARLMQSQKMEAVGRLAGGVAHDFNNLLTVILGTCQMMADDPQDAETQREDLETILLAAKTAETLTQKLLAFSRQQVLQPSVTTFNDAVEGMGLMLPRLVGEQIRVVTDLAPDPWSIMADPSQIEQVLMNLAVNARDAMAQGGVMTLRTRNTTLDDHVLIREPLVEPGPFAVLEVEDEGEGMSPEVVGKIFEPFFTTKATDRGTGLGLSMVHGIVKQSGGFIDVTSMSGVGTCVSIYLPKHDGETREYVTQNERAIKHEGRVLVVEDEDQVRMITVRMLEHLGMTVFSASSPLEALDIMSQGHGLDVLLLDVVMPEMSGPRLAHKARQLDPLIDVIFMSGYTANEIERQGLTEEEIDFIQKPFSLSQLSRKLAEVTWG